MKTYGAPCDTDTDCQALLGPNGTCIKDILGVYALPGGYCTTFCVFPISRPPTSPTPRTA